MLLEMYRAPGTGLRRRANPQSTPSAAMVPDMPSRKTVSSTASKNQGWHPAGQEQPGREAVHAKIDFGIDGLNPILQVPPRQRVDCAGAPEVVPHLNRRGVPRVRSRLLPPSCSVAKSMSPSCDGPVNPRSASDWSGPKVRVGVVDLVEHPSPLPET